MTPKKRFENICDAAEQRYPYEVNRFYGFTKGAQWADNNPPQDVVNLNEVWHDVSEMPEETSCEMLYEIRSGLGCSVTNIPDGLTMDEWSAFLKVCGATRWAYISDLLPKGGEK